MKNRSFEEQILEVEEFQNICRQRLNSGDAANRYCCIRALASAIQKKSGAYTEDDRRDWLTILYACLAAPDCYFTQYPTKLQQKKKVKSFQVDHLLLREKLDVEMTKSSGMYSYIDSLRDYLRIPDYKIAETASSDKIPLAEKLHKKLSKALKCRAKKYPEYVKYEYEKVLDQILVKEQGRLNHPVFFLFLPFYVFIELAKCENAIGSDQTNPASIPQLNSETLNWSIRSSPFTLYHTDSIKKLMELYGLIEQALCEVLTKENIHTIGKTVWKASCEYSGISINDFFQRQASSPSNECKSAEDIYKSSDAHSGKVTLPINMEDDDSDACYAEENALFFSVPLWKYNIWALCFSRVFHLVLCDIKQDIHRLFSLSFRISSPKSTREKNLIYEKYKGCEMHSSKRTFCLSDLLTALCTIYNSEYFTAEDPFQNPELQASISLLSNFMAALTYWDEIEQQGWPERWIKLLRFGYPNDRDVFLFDNYDELLMNPSRILVQTLFLRALANKWSGNIYEDGELQEYFCDTVYRGDYENYDTFMQMIRDALDRCLTSSKEIFRDIAFWGGIKIVEGHHKFIDGLRKWSFWHEAESKMYIQIAQYIAKKPSCLDDFLQQIELTGSKPTELTLDSIDYFDTTDRLKEGKLEKYKLQVLTSLPNQIWEIFETFGNKKSEKPEIWQEITTYRQAASFIRKEFDGLDPLLSKLREISENCPKLKLRDTSLQEVIDHLETISEDNAECFDISFLSRDKRELLEHLRSVDDKEEYFHTVEQIKLDLVWLKNFSESIRSIFSKSSKIRQRHSDFFEMIDAITTSEKITKKRLVLKQFPGQMRKLLTDLNPLDDFQYFLLLYILFSALRKQLCHQSYALCMKFLPLMRGEFSPVMMSYLKGENFQ